MSNSQVEKQRKKWVGTTRLMKNGQTATIVDYRGVCDIDVVFEDGFIAKNRTLCSFKNGVIKNPNIRAAYIQGKIGMENIMNNGMRAKICQYRKSTDLDVIFEDGTIVKSLTFDRFKKGQVPHPDPKKSRRAYIGAKWLNRTERMKNGLLCTIIEYYSATNITVRFENGTIRRHITTQNFMAREIREKEYSPDERMGTISYSKEGLKARIVEYSKSTDYIIEFEDGQKTHGCRYPNFLNGKFVYPNFNRGYGVFHDYIFRDVNFELNGEKYFNVIKPNGESDILTIHDVMKLCNITPLF